MANHKRIYAFILGMVANYQDAEDIFQQTILIMWSKFDRYERGTSFTSWGATVAKYEILNARMVQILSERKYRHRLGLRHGRTKALACH